MNRAVVVIPTYNEVSTIEKLIIGILNLNRDLDIIVIDDGSPDGTGRLLDYLSAKFTEIKIMHRLKKSGLGTAYAAAFKKALADGYEYIIYMDGDLSHKPEYIPSFLDNIKDCDLVLGSRYINGINIVNWSFFRLFLSLSAKKYIRFMTGLPFSDLLGGFRCFRKHALQQVIKNRLISRGYFFQTEILYYAYQNGYRIKEIPITFEDRSIGKSKLSLGIIFEALFKCIILRLKSVSSKYAQEKSF